MAGIDKAAIAFTIGIVAVAVAIASAGESLQNTGPGGSLSLAPVVTQEPVEPEEAKESQKTMEEMMEQQRQGILEEEEEMETSPVEVTEPEVEEVPVMTGGPQTVLVIIPVGTSVPGCEQTNECWLPSSVNINAGDTVSWSNDDTAAHTVTSGTATEGPDGTFDSSLLMAGNSFDVTFDTSGSFDYFCMVHPWMVGDVQVS